jgi:septum formation topological specificity factor MinE
MRMARKVLVLMVAIVVGALVAPSAGAEPSGPTRHDKRCDVLVDLVPATVSVATGAAGHTAGQARVLRKLADRELTPKKVKTALREVADWFAAAPDRSQGERARQLTALRKQVVAIVRWYVKICAAQIAATTSTTVPPG